MSISVIDISNMALRRMGSGKVITAFYPDESTEEARVITGFWESNRDATLSLSPWKCARKRAQLNQDVAAPAYGWDYKYTLPSDFIREVEVVNGSEIEVSYTIEGGKLLSNADEIYMKYVFKQTDTTKYHPLVIEAMACRLAHVICIPLGKSKTLKDMLFKEYKDVLSDARDANAFEYEEDSVKKTDSWVKSRFRGSGSSEVGEVEEEE